MAEGTNFAKLDASRLTRTLNDDPRSLPSPDDLAVRLLEYHTDHIIIASWNVSNGWSSPILQPYGPIPIPPAASGLHYATQSFEGLKLIRGADGRLRLFRPIENCERMRRSAAQVALPDFDALQLEKLIVALCAHEAPKWLPKDQGEGSLYIRPTLIGTDTALATLRPRSALLYIFLTVFPKLTSSITGHEASPQKVAAPPKRCMRLLASDQNQNRSWPGGYGNSKVGANYGPTLALQGEAKSRGYDQILWLFGPERHITEAGASNFFVVLRVNDTTWQLVTPPLDRGLILPGITRASVLQLARDLLPRAVGGVLRVDVVEREITMREIAKDHADGSIIEAFVSGTALFITSVGVICWDGRVFEINSEPVNGVSCSQIIKDILLDIMKGKVEHEWALLVDED
ncbi:Branched-chain-amino-acid aminotransferase, mitochondrial [Fulvia fulva]|uniref:Branched-chain-amino-acid aminotransferase n=1 Tax=Passalora fulva TaxID=5499 RepID=A0A9Q8LI26_PASFU|nr:Branched-chain-amino-acid aminotransferase, mitochondrial [Fulvia fulva]KAK4623641.1 Branched-chain-amino-acid aminotransferase, mitochondrial [Fulvia fulva]KAK4625097.1 Branched-chain-amino-acid aminotransferase, mitochondrial [Fulvia fulva]UJO17885.1 Branched-chain-amino-acid aminotransferase, mitochondrial [Fulvia fulva]WPV15183.1 Branched-chain-amino-acid aminotransferase, mitochondrial [Fulvia fulva]WPV29956.1 Branched-chain-amino-acid aminotransferase, mitochondrial [Fulvia fulva]